MKILEHLMDLEVVNHAATTHKFDTVRGEENSARLFVKNLIPMDGRALYYLEESLP